MIISDCYFLAVCLTAGGVFGLPAETAKEMSIKRNKVKKL